MDQRTRRSPARFLPPLALIAVLVAFLAIMSGSGGGEGRGDSDQPSTGAAETSATNAQNGADSTTTTARKKKARSKTRTYTVQVGDTLGGIADKTGVPLQTIEELNPDVDPQAMVAGQKIKLE